MAGLYVEMLRALVEHQYVPSTEQDGSSLNERRVLVIVLVYLDGVGDG